MYTYISVRNKVSEEFLFDSTGWIVSPDLDGDSMYDFNVRYAWKVLAAVKTAVVVTDSFMVDLIGHKGETGTCVGDKIEVRYRNKHFHYFMYHIKQEYICVAHIKPKPVFGISDQVRHKSAYTSTS